MKIMSISLAIILVLLAGSTADPETAAEEKPKHSGKSVGPTTSPEECGDCHVAIYREYTFGYGADTIYKGIVPTKEKKLSIPAHTSTIVEADRIFCSNK